MTNAIAKILGDLLRFIYNTVGDYGLAIIILTILVKSAMIPLTNKQNKSMLEMNKIQPKLKEIQKKYPKDKNKQAELTQKLYREHNINPMMGCLPLLIQMPILIGLFKALRKPVEFVFGSEQLYNMADKGFFWLENLKNPDVIVVAGITLPFILPIIAALATFIDTKMTMLKQANNEGDNPGANIQKTMIYMMPLMILLWGRSFPAGLSLYWALSTLFSIAQRNITNMINDKG